MQERFTDRGAVFVLDEGQHAEPLLLRFLSKVVASATYAGCGPRAVLIATDGGRDLRIRYPGPHERRQVRLEPLTAAELASLMRDLGVEADLAARAATALFDSWHRSPRAAKLLADELALHAEPLPQSEILALLSSGASGMRPLFERRFGRLSEPLRELLEVTAVSATGINFWRFDRLGGFSRDEVASLTGALLSQGILRRSYPGGKLRMIFQESEERLIVYAQIPEDKRRFYHAQFARIVEEDDLDPEEKSSEVGRHLILSGDELSGAGKLLDAGKHAFGRGRIEEARRHFEDVSRRGRKSRALKVERLYAHEGLADIEARTGSLDQAAKGFARILEEGEGLLLAEDRVRLLRKQGRARSRDGQVGDAQALLDRAQRECTEELVVERALLFDEVANLGIRRGDLNQASTASHRALALAHRARDERLLAAVHRTVGAIKYAMGELHDALADLKAARELYEKLGDPDGYGNVCTSTGNAYHALGKLPEAIAEHRAALRIFEGLSDTLGVTRALNNLATLHITVEELDEAESYLNECLRLQRRRGDHQGAAIALVNLAAIANNRCDYERSLALAEEAVSMLDRTAAPAPVAVACQVARANALLSLGRLGEALAMCLEIEEKSRATSSTLSLVRGLSSAGNALLGIGDFDAAEEKLIEALSLAQQHGYVGETSSALFALVELEMERGNLGQARRHLETVLAQGPHPSPSDRRWHEVFDITLRHRAGELTDADREALIAIAESGTSDTQARAARVLAEALPPQRAIGLARRSYEIVKRTGQRELLWIAALRLGEIEKALGIAEAAGHLDESARTVLSIAADLPERLRERYLGSYGRRRVLLHARRLE
ncbi:MAG: tetratricopeptide repeat protein [Acidobacteriota bacterium]